MLKLNWVNGRQNDTYFKLKIIESKLFEFDVHILKYPTGSFVGVHRDPVHDRRHHRLNIVLNKNFDGGVFEKWHTVSSELITDRIVKFRPDIEEHAVLKITKGTRYVLSIGWLK